MANLKDVIYLSNEDYDTLVSTGTVTIDGDVLTYDESNVYITPEVTASSSQDGLMSAADKVKLDGIEAEMANYLPLTGGTLSLANADSLKIKRTASSAGAYVRYYNNNQDTNYWMVGMKENGVFMFNYNGADKAWIDSSGNLYEGGTALVNKYGRLASTNTWTSTQGVKTTSVPSLELKNTSSSGGAFIDYENNNQTTNYWRVGMRNDGPFSFAYNGSVMASISTSGSIYENGTALSSKYLGISAKAADSSKLNNQEASYYLNYNNFTNKPILGTAAAANTGTSSGNVPILDSNGKLNTSVLPALAITDTFVVNSQSAMLALSAQVGDVCVRTDLNKSYILKTAGASTLANWQELLTPTDAVLSVNGKTGAVTLSASDVGALSSGTAYVSTVNGVSGAITNVAKTNIANTFTGNNTFSGAFSATDGGSISADSGDVVLDVSPSGIDLNSRYGVNIYASERGYISAYEPIQYSSGVTPSSGSDLVPKSYVDNKTYATSIATSSGTNQLTLAFGTKYALTAGGTSYVFTMPSNPNTNQTVKAGSTTFGANAAVAITAGTRITVTPNTTNNTITIATSATADSAITNAQIDTLF